MAPLGQLLLGLAALAQVWLRRWLVRAGLGLGLGLAALHLLLNKAALPLANRQLLPGLLAEAEALSLREVRQQQTHSSSNDKQQRLSAICVCAEMPGVVALCRLMRI
jgi:hypothetical protein